MLKENFLLDTFVASGNDLDDLSILLKEFEAHTKFVRLQSDALKVLSMTKDRFPDKIECFLLDPQDVLPGDSRTQPFSAPFRRIDKTKVLGKGDFSSLIEEAENNIGVILYDDIKLYYLSSAAFSDLCQFGIKGDFAQKQCFARDLAMAEQFRSKKPITLVCKTFNTVSKVFAIRSGKYTDVGQTILLDIAERVKSAGLGTMKCREWSATNFMTQVYIEFPEKAEELKTYYGLKDSFVPGLWLATSDTGNCSVIVNGTWRSGNSITLQNKVSREHSGNVSAEAILEVAEKEIFAEYTKLPEALCDLMAIDITEPSWDLTQEKGMRRNKKAIDGVVKSVFKQIDLVKAIGKKNEKKLYEQLCDEFDPSLAFTAYDIAKAIMEMPERLSGLNTTSEREFKKAVGRAAFVKYDAPSEPTSLVLTA